jgi:hypothetical protein
MRRQGGRLIRAAGHQGGPLFFIQQSIYPEFVKRFAERANRLRVGDPTDPNTQVLRCRGECNRTLSPSAVG